MEGVIFFKLLLINKVMESVTSLLIYGMFSKLLHPHHFKLQSCNLAAADGLAAGQRLIYPSRQAHAKDRIRQAAAARG